MRNTWPKRATDAEIHEALVRRCVEEVVNGDDLDLMDEIVAEDDSTDAEGDNSGRAALKLRLGRPREATRSLGIAGRYVIDELAHAGDTVAIRMRLLGKTADDRVLDAHVRLVARLCDAQIAAIWQVTDD